MNPEEEIEGLKAAAALGEEQKRVLDDLGWHTELDAEPHGTEAMLNFYRARSAVYTGILAGILLEIMQNGGCPKTISGIILKGMR